MSLNHTTVRLVCHTIYNSFKEVSWHELWTIDITKTIIGDNYTTLSTGLNLFQDRNTLL